MSDDELDDLLRPRTIKGPDRKAAVLKASLQVLPRRSYRWSIAVKIAAVFLIGFGTGWLVKPAPAGESPVIIKERVEVRVPTDSEAKSESPGMPISLDALETRAELADAPVAAKLYRQIGDLYLHRTDIAAATRCYRLHSNEAGAAGLEPAADDSWLLLSMKSSTRRERVQ